MSLDIYGRQNNNEIAFSGLFPDVPPPPTPEMPFHQPPWSKDSKGRQTDRKDGDKQRKR